MKKTFSLILIISAAVIAYIFFTFLNSDTLAEKPLAELSWKSGTHLITIEDQKNSEQALTVYTSDEAKPWQLEQGQWGLSYIQANEFILYGYRGNTTSSMEAFGILPSGGVQIDISQLPGRISTIVPHYTGPHILVSGITNTYEENDIASRYTCVPKQIAPTMSPCKRISGDIIPHSERNAFALYQSWWNPNELHELYIQEILQDGSVTQYVYNADTELVTTSTELLSPPTPRDTRVSFDDALSFEKKKRTLYVRDASDDVIATIATEEDAQYYWLKNNYLLEVIGNALSIIDPVQKTKSNFPTLEHSEDVTVSVFSPLYQ